MMATLSGVSSNSGKRFIVSLASMFVYCLTRRMCSPLSTFLYSTISPSTSMSVSLFLLKRSDCSFRSLCCLCMVLWYWYSLITFLSLSRISRGSNGAWRHSAMPCWKSSSSNGMVLSRQRMRTGNLPWRLYCPIVFSSW